MTPPKASDKGKDCTSDMASAVLLCAEETIQTLRKRSDFLRAASALRIGTGSFLLQARARGDDSQAIRIGFTASKKIGNAVARNRAKRRMRALVQRILPQHGQVGWDYVLVAKPTATVSRDFSAMLADLTRALRQVHGQKDQP